MHTILVMMMLALGFKGSLAIRSCYLAHVHACNHVTVKYAKLLQITFCIDAAAPCSVICDAAIAVDATF